MESVKVTVVESPDDDSYTACTDTSEHTEKYSASWSTGVFLGHAGHEEGG